MRLLTSRPGALRLRENSPKSPDAVTGQSERSSWLGQPLNSDALIYKLYKSLLHLTSLDQAMQHPPLSLENQAVGKENASPTLSPAQVLVCCSKMDSLCQSRDLSSRDEPSQTFLRTRLAVPTDRGKRGFNPKSFMCSMTT
ncbi:hypothetical protein JHW43_008116 [Diplocarpon mali]|nr:hypothetical protein JHW43_008116 [Diplocarpon mali]